jgi:hypothetical protein
MSLIQKIGIIAVILVGCIVGIWGVITISKSIGNFIVERRGYKHPDETNQKHGLVYKKSNNKEGDGVLEADQSPLSLF